MIFFANPSKQFQSYEQEIRASVEKVLSGKNFILGDEVQALEDEFSKYIGCKHSIGVANGTDAIELALRALDIGLNDEVITVSHTAVATVAAIEATGAKATLVDVNEEYYTLDPTYLEKAITRKTKAIIAVHLYGHPAPIEEISNFCLKNNLKLIEDVSQAHGAEWCKTKLGNFGDFGCFSCYPTKNLGALGDAGLITTNNSELANKVRLLREYGWAEKYISSYPGRNSRLDELQATILGVKLKYLDNANEKRKKIALTYNTLLKDTPLFLPKKHKNADHVYHIFAIRTNERDKLLNYLRKNEIFAGIHYPVPIHMQPAYKQYFEGQNNLKNTEKISKQVLSLPIYPELSASEINSVSDCLINFF